MKYIIAIVAALIAAANLGAEEAPTTAEAMKAFAESSRKEDIKTVVAIDATMGKIQSLFGAVKKVATKKVSELTASKEAVTVIQKLDDYNKSEQEAMRSLLGFVGVAAEAVTPKEE